MSMEKMDKYLEESVGAIKQIRETQSAKIQQAAAIVAESIAADGLVYLFGTGHSHMLALEAYSRAGGLAPVKPILEDNLMLHQGAFKSGAMERLSGYAAAILAQTEISKKDCLFIFSNSGRNAVPIEMAIEAKKRGIKTIAVTSLAHSKSVLSRHESGKRLFEVSDLVIDNCAPSGDAAVPISNSPISAGPLSTITGSFILHSITILAAENLSARGITPPIFISGNAQDSEIHNLNLYQKYKNRVKF